MDVPSECLTSVELSIALLLAEKIILTITIFLFCRVFFFFSFFCISSKYIFFTYQGKTFFFSISVRSFGIVAAADALGKRELYFLSLMPFSGGAVWFWFWPRIGRFLVTAGPCSLCFSGWAGHGLGS